MCESSSRNFFFIDVRLICCAIKFLLLIICKFRCTSTILINLSQSLQHTLTDVGSHIQLLAILEEHVSHDLAMNLVNNCYVLLGHPTNIRMLAQQTWNYQFFQDSLPVPSWFTFCLQLLKDHQDKLESSKDNSLGSLFGARTLYNYIHAGLNQLAFIGPLIVLKDTYQALFRHITHSIIQFLHFRQKQGDERLDFFVDFLWKNFFTTQGCLHSQSKNLQPREKHLEQLVITASQGHFQTCLEKLEGVLLLKSLCPTRF